MFCRNLRLSTELKNIVSYVNEFNQPITCRKSFVSCCNAIKNKQVQPKLQTSIIGFCSQQLPKSSSIFGDISGRKFEHFEMDKDEQEEEKFQDTEAIIPRRLKPSKGQYERMIKLHIGKKDLDSALKVLDLIKENRDKPTMYIYNLLLRAFSMQGDIKRCFGLYNKAKQRGLQPNEATYTCLFNACAMSDKSTIALEHLDKLRQSLSEQQFLLNQTHYNVMIKAYSWHNQIIKAFELADEMRDNRITIGESTYNSLFHAVIADKEAGLRHALVVWHLMRRWKIKPTLTTYNLFLRAIRDTNFGNLKINDVLLSGYEQIKILLKEGERPDLLASPPILSTLLPLTETKQNAILNQNNHSTNEQNIPQNESIYLNNISNRLILFGGLEGFLNRMINDGIEPDAKTITLLLDLIPNIVSAEDLLIKIADQRNINLDIDFYNMLIKRRSIRHDYKAAKEILSITEQKNLSPNIMTFGVLALGCQNYKDAKEFLDGIKMLGYVPNAVIMSTLIKTACIRTNFKYLLFVMDYMISNKMKPNSRVIKDLEDFSSGISKLQKPTDRYRLRKSALKRLEKDIEKFEQQYLKWQTMIKK